LKRKAILAATALFLTATLYVFILTILNVQSPPMPGDCGERAPFNKPVYPGQAVFVVKILYSGGDNWTSAKKRGPWSIGRIEHRYWGLPWWTPGLVLIGHSYFLHKNERYFIDGDRTMYRISVFTPYIDFTCASRTSPLADAEIDLRILDSPQKKGVRIIGRAYHPKTAERDREFASGVTIKIIGPAGTVTSQTDQHGIYDVVGLPPGHYIIRSESKAQLDSIDRQYYELKEPELKDGDVWGRTVYVN
jgi:hypothetical protein